MSTAAVMAKPASVEDTVCAAQGLALKLAEIADDDAREMAFQGALALFPQGHAELVRAVYYPTMESEVEFRRWR